MTLQDSDRRLLQRLRTDISLRDNSADYVELLDRLTTAPPADALEGGLGPGELFARELVSSDAPNFIGAVYETDKGDVEVLARYINGKTPADKLAELEQLVSEGNRGCVAIDTSPSHQAGVPDGWVIVRADDEIRVVSPLGGPGGMVLSGESGRLERRLLYSLALAIVEARDADNQA